MRKVCLAMAVALLPFQAQAHGEGDILTLMASYCLGANTVILHTWDNHPATAPPAYGRAALVVNQQRLLAFTQGAQTNAEMFAGLRGMSDARTMLNGAPKESAAAFQRLLRCREVMREIP